MQFSACTVQAGFDAGSQGMTVAPVASSSATQSALGNLLAGAGTLPNDAKKAVDPNGNLSAKEVCHSVDFSSAESVLNYVRFDLDLGNSSSARNNARFLARSQWVTGSI